MRVVQVLVATLLCVGFGSLAQAQPGPSAQEVGTQVAKEADWAYNTYHVMYPDYCFTCYGGGGCGKDGNRGDCANGACNSRGGVGHCATHKPGIETCRRCGILGRILFYECQRLACNQRGGDGCENEFGLPGDCGSCVGCGCGHGKGSRTGPIARFQARPLGGYASLTGPFQFKYHCYGFREGQMTYYGQCCGCYEGMLNGQFNDRGPLNLGANVPADLAPTMPASPYRSMPMNDAAPAPAEVEGEDDLAPPFEGDPMDLSSIL